MADVERTTLSVPWIKQAAAIHSEAYLPKRAVRYDQDRQHDGNGRVVSLATGCRFIRQVSSRSDGLRPFFKHLRIVRNNGVVMSCTADLRTAFANPFARSINRAVGRKPHRLANIFGSRNSELVAARSLWWIGQHSF